MANIPTAQNNPGDIKQGGQIATYSSPAAGQAALYNDLTAKMTGTSTTGVGPSSSLVDFAKVYAPDSDGNNSLQYAASLANQLGVSPDTQIGTLKGRIDDFAKAVSHNEGYQGPTGAGGNAGNPTSPQFPLAAQQNTQSLAQPNQNTGFLGTNPSDSLYGKVLDNSLTRGVKDVGDFLTGGGATQLGTAIGNGNGQGLVPGLLKTGTGIGALALTGGASSLISGAGSALESEPVIATLTKYAGSDAISSLTAAEKVNALTEAANNAEAGIKPIFTKALQELAPQVMKEAGVGSFSELNPTIAKTLGLTGNALKTLLKYAGIATVAGIAGGEGSKIINAVKGFL